ncbi:MAG: hypothetical protein JNM51_08115 [Bacteroidia bacterium]|nr:hypothetical protein [Bacteroidia bacterium]
MKFFWSFILCVFLCLFNINKTNAQADTLHLYQSYYSFSNSEKAEWTAFENNWNYIAYTELKQKYNIKKLNCKNCGNFYADIYLEINESGKLTVSSFKKGKICGQSILNKGLIKEFEGSIKSQTFKYLKNKQFIARFGHILKC